MAHVALVFTVGTEPISGFSEDSAGRHAFAGWIDLVNAIAASAERRNGGLTDAP